MKAHPVVLVCRWAEWQLMHAHEAGADWEQRLLCGKVVIGTLRKRVVREAGWAHPLPRGVHFWFCFTGEATAQAYLSRAGAVRRLNKLGQRAVFNNDRKRLRK